MLERELQKQRERVTAIIEEKERQLVDLQQHYLPVYQFSEESSSTDVRMLSKFTLFSNSRFGLGSQSA